MSTGTANPTTTPVDNDPWNMEVGKGGGGDYVLCPPGNYPATIVGLFDVGHLPQISKDGKAYDARKIVIVFELTKLQPDGKPFLLGERYTWSMRDNSNFYELASNLTGKKFNEGDRFDPRQIVGMPCMVQVTNTATNKNGKEKTYHNVGSITQFPEGLPKPTPRQAAAVWSVMSGQPLPDTSWVPYVYGSSIVDMVETSTEYKSGKVASVRSTPPAAPPVAEGEDRCPF